MIDKGTYIYLRNELTRRDERKVEKGYVNIDKPALLNKIISLYKSVGYSLEDLAKITKLTVDNFCHYFEDNPIDEIKIKRLVPLL